MESMLAWIGEDEFGNGEVGIKRAMLDGNVFVLCMLEGQRNSALLKQLSLFDQLQHMADQYRKPVRLVRFREAETLAVIMPTTH
jgi:hypothetical protein